VARLAAYRGITHLGGLSLAAEVCDWRPFGTAGTFMAFTGLTPSEHSSGEKTRRGHITHAGNLHLRTQLVESAWAYKSRPGVVVDIRRRHEGLEQETIARVYAAQVRLCGRFRRRDERKTNRNILVAAIARELAGFIWAEMTARQMPHHHDHNHHTPSKLRPTAAGMPPRKGGREVTSARAGRGRHPLALHDWATPSPGPSRRDRHSKNPPAYGLPSRFCGRILTPSPPAWPMTSPVVAGIAALVHTGDSSVEPDRSTNLDLVANVTVALARSCAETRARIPPCAGAPPPQNRPPFNLSYAKSDGHF
jgi:hypothetical protein